MKSKVEKHFDKVAVSYDSGKEKYSYYYDSLKKLLGTLIPEGEKVFEIGCGTGDLLGSLEPKQGYGMDISSEMIRLAKLKHGANKNLTFSTKFPPSKSFDYIFMSDVIEHLENPKKEFEKISELMDRKSTFIITMANPIWEPLLMFWEKMGWKMKEGKHERISFDEIKKNLEEAGFKIIEHDYSLLIPIKIPFITNFANKYFEKFLKPLAFIEYFIATLNNNVKSN